MERLVQCRNCKAPLRFVRTARGALMPCEARAVLIDPGPGPIIGIDIDGNIVKGSPTADANQAVRVWVSHFAACPGANAFRKTKRP